MSVPACCLSPIGVACLLPRAGSRLQLRAAANQSQDLSPQMTRKPNAQNRAPLMRLSGQPALKVCLAASSKQDGNE